MSRNIRRASARRSLKITQKEDICSVVDPHHALLLTADCTLAGAPPKFGLYTGTVRVAKTSPTIGTARCVAAVKAVYSEYGTAPLTGFVTLQYRPSPCLEGFWNENISNEFYVMNMAANGESEAIPIIRRSRLSLTKPL